MVLRGAPGASLKDMSITISRTHIKTPLMKQLPQQQEGPRQRSTQGVRRVLPLEQQQGGPPPEQPLQQQPLSQEGRCLQQPAERVRLEGPLEASADLSSTRLLPHRRQQGRVLLPFIALIFLLPQQPETPIPLLRSQEAAQRPQVSLQLIIIIRN